MQNYWHTKTTSELLEIFHSKERGLSKEEVIERLQKFGPNKLPEGKVDSLPIIFFHQFQSPLIYILIVASIIVFIMGEIIDGSIILAVLLFNAIVGTTQEGKAQNTLLALKKFVETNATVLRDDKEFVTSDSEVVPGDVLLLMEGDKIPADARVIFSNNLKIDEASLTGESEPVQKTIDVINTSNLPLTEQKNMVFKGSHVVAGRGKAIVVATGINTTIGKIAKEISTIDTEIPLKTNIRHLSRLIIVAVVGVSILIFSLGVFLGKSLEEMFTTVVSLSVSIIPEGLPIVVTLVLATGVWRMSKRNALVKKLQAVEALGQASLIAVDKTGTITKNELVIQKLYVSEKFFEIRGIGYEPKGEILLGKNIIDPLNHPEILFVGKVAAFCADAHAAYNSQNKIWQVFGDPTEVALAVFAEKIGFRKDDLEHESPKTSEIPFDYKEKYRATAHKINNHNLLTVVSAPEIALKLSSKEWVGGSLRDLSDENKKNLESMFLEMSREGLRVLALAIKENVPENIGQEDIRDLTFVGFVGMKDALRPEAKEAVQRAISAGIRVIMITGDHKLTAQSIAKEAGIFQDQDETLTGQEIDEFSDDELSQKLAGVSVFARVTPEHKLRIIKAYRKQKEIVAMTGDGVNDAPSLIAADLGVAMGKIGTEVAKEASDIVLLDDNFGSIISAIEEGRSIYKTIKKVILYLFAGSWSQVLVILGSLFLGLPLPLLAAQIIWLNFVTDGFLDVALAMEPKEDGLLRNNFDKPKKYIIDNLTIRRIIVMAIPLAIGVLALFNLHYEADITKAWTIALTTLAVGHWLNAWSCRHESKSIFQMNFFSNKFLVVGTTIIIFLQMLAIYNPLMQKLLRTTELSLQEWAMIIPVATIIVLAEEIRKFFYRRSLSINSKQKTEWSYL